MGKCDSKYTEVCPYCKRKMLLPSWKVCDDMICEEEHRLHKLAMKRKLLITE